MGDFPLARHDIARQRKRQRKPARLACFRSDARVGDSGGAPLHGRHKSVTPSGDRRDVERLFLRVAQRSPQAVHVDLEVALMDEDAGPGGRHQFVLADRLAAALRQQVQQLERPAAQFHRRAVEHEQLPAWKEAERPERVDDLLPHRTPPSCRSAAGAGGSADFTSFNLRPARR